MNNRLSKLAVFVLAFFIGGCTLFGTPPTKTPPPTPTPEAATQKSLKDLFAAGISQKCTFKDTEAETNIQGTVYATSGKFRGDFSTVASGQTFGSHMIVDGTTSYVWMDGQKKGFKSTFESTSDFSQPSVSPESKDQVKDMDLNKKVSYDCTPWILDDALLKLPADVEFTDMSSLMMPTKPAGLNESEGDNSSQCAACDSLSGAAKTQCRSALNCK